jgi:WD repeat-containing protein 68
MDWNKSKRSSFSVGSYKPINISEHERYPSFSSQAIAAPLQAQLPTRSAYYETYWPLYCSDWSTRPSGLPQNEIVAISTYREDAVNKIEVLNSSLSPVEHPNGTVSDGLDFVKISEANVDLPLTKLQWDPSSNASVNRLITTSDRLKLWEVDFNNMLIERASLVNLQQRNNQGQSLPPLTSFDWNKVSTNIVITSSMDTTCTVWDLNSISAPKTQLIAHDSEVFDVQFIKGSCDIFASVGCDGSMRVFDLRALDHSTIVYEPPTTVGAAESATSNAMSSSTRGNVPLLRLATSNTDQNIIATFSSNSDTVSIMDLRYPGQPTLSLAGHSAKLNSIKWHPTEPKLLSGGDDCQALIWDLSTANTGRLGTAKPKSGVEYPDYSYSDTFEVNNVCWSPAGDWIGVTSGKGFQGVRV